LKHKGILLTDHVTKINSDLWFFLFF